ncbi:AraC family transcriptional regulator [Sulfurimonas microaerophilic]|uniref:AraC family transcriptional regulator n=1 Tax=Sulfurimonas microaerophilic TaxID=3058392 RepID=UPI002714F5F9|nr:AraC family transcriptional regulator [Sulfurimonas sp. hsl 1-7]
MKEILIQELLTKYGCGKRQGFKHTFLDEVKLFQINHHEQGKPLLYKRGIILIASGQKRGYIDNQQVTLSSDHYVIIAAVQPFECASFVFDKVTKGLYIDLDMQRLQRITALLDEIPQSKTKKMPQNVVTGDMNNELDSAFNSLMKSLLDPQDSRVLGEHILDEIYYRIIQSEAGKHLVELCSKNTQFSRISNIVDDIQDHLEDTISIDELARKTGMSKANFHRKFKEIFNDSPIQYIKKVKLNKARQYILFEKMKVVDAAYKVGYESPAQFSREFKSQFGFPPSELKKIVL